MLIEYIRIALVKRNNISQAELARRLGVSPQALNSKMQRNSFTEKDLQAIAEALDCELSIQFIDKNTGKPL